MRQGGKGEGGVNGGQADHREAGEEEKDGGQVGKKRAAVDLLREKRGHGGLTDPHRCYTHALEAPPPQALMRGGQKCQCGSARVTMATNGGNDPSGRESGITLAERELHNGLSAVEVSAPPTHIGSIDRHRVAFLSPFHGDAPASASEGREGAVIPRARRGVVGVDGRNL